MKLQLETSSYQQVEILYDELSEYYHFLYTDIEGINKKIAQELDLKLLKPLGIQKILDCSCGTGHMIIELAKLGYEVTGSDISGKMIERSISNAIRAGIKNINFFQTNILDLSSNIKEKFDAVICRGNSFSHIEPNDFEIAIKNMGTLLKKGGLCYIDIRNYEAVIQEKPLFEHRAHLQFGSKDIVSFYILDYKENSRTYNIFFVFFDRESNSISHKLVTIDGYFVFEDDLLRAFKNAGFENIKKMQLENESKDINILRGTKI
ncbi:MAG: class I SAM-dependent methyltransferase [Nitrospirota bacterium]